MMMMTMIMTNTTKRKYDDDHATDKAGDCDSAKNDDR